MSSELPNASTLRQLLTELRGGFTLYAPILIRVGGEDVGEMTQDRTTSLSQPLDWGDHYTREYGNEPFIVLGPNTLGTDRPVTIGRSRASNVRIENESVSKLHASFVADRPSGDYYIVDEGSRNGTYINGDPLTAGVRMPIWAGAYIGFGDAVFVFIDPPTLRKLARMAG